MRRGAAARGHTFEGVSSAHHSLPVCLIAIGAWWRRRQIHAMVHCRREPCRVYVEDALSVADGKESRDHTANICIAIGAEDHTFPTIAIFFLSLTNRNRRQHSFYLSCPVPLLHAGKRELLQNIQTRNVRYGNERGPLAKQFLLLIAKKIPSTVRARLLLFLSHIHSRTPSTVCQHRQLLRYQRSQRRWWVPVARLKQQEARPTTTAFYCTTTGARSFCVHSRRGHGGEQHLQGRRGTCGGAARPSTGALFQVLRCPTAS